MRAHVSCSSLVTPDNGQRSSPLASFRVSLEYGASPRATPAAAEAGLTAEELDEVSGLYDAWVQQGGIESVGTP
jgi:hypothetical protein